MTRPYDSPFLSSKNLWGIFKLTDLANLTHLQKIVRNLEVLKWMLALPYDIMDCILALTEKYTDSLKRVKLPYSAPESS